MENVHPLNDGSPDYFYGCLVVGLDHVLCCSISWLISVDSYGYFLMIIDDVDGK